MNNLRINEIRVDGREFKFRPGPNYIIGKNATGKTTLFNSIKFALGLISPVVQYPFGTVELTISIGQNELVLSRNAGQPELEAYANGRSTVFKARSRPLENFYSYYFSPNFVTGDKYSSLFPMLELCFLTGDSPKSTKSLWPSIRLVCGVNDKVIAKAKSYLDELRNQVEDDNRFIDRNRKYVEVFLSKLTGLSTEVQDKIHGALKEANSAVCMPIEENRELLFSSTYKLDDLRSRSENHFRARLEEVDHHFSLLKDAVRPLGQRMPSIEELATKSPLSVSYGEITLANLLALIAIARANVDRELNFPGVLINDNYLSRSLDFHSIVRARSIVNSFAIDEPSFQYIEFSTDSEVPSEYISGSLDVGRSTK